MEGRGRGERIGGSFSLGASLHIRWREYHDHHHYHLHHHLHLKNLVFLKDIIFSSFSCDSILSFFMFSLDVESCSLFYMCFGEKLQ